VNALLVGVGGLVGCLARYGAYILAQRWFHGTPFAIGTIFVNLAGCLIVGVVTRLGESAGGMSEEARALVVVGLLGGFTTFSAFGYETVVAVRAGHHLVAFGSAAVQVFGGFACVLLGRALASWFLGNA
jgi:CrcB protein